jgi:hypothetical protein
MRTASILMFALLTGCSNKETPKASSPNPVSEKEHSTSSLSIFLNQLETSCNQFDSRIQETLAQIQAQSSKASADLLFLNFKKEYSSFAEAVNDKLLKNSSAQNIESGNNKEIDLLKATLHRHGLDLVIDMGAVFADESADYLFRTYGQWLSPEMRKYLDLRRAEQRLGFSSDAGLTISWDQVSDRIASWDEFLEQHPNFVAKTEAKSWHEIYLRTYLTGMDNSRVFAEDGVLDPDVKKSYERFLALYRNTKSAKVMENYFLILRNNNYRDGPYIEKFLQDHKLRTMLGVEPPIR